MLPSRLGLVIRLASMHRSCLRRLINSRNGLSKKGRLNLLPSQFGHAFTWLWCIQIVCYNWGFKGQAVAKVDTEQDISKICFAIALAGFSERFKGILVDIWDMVMRAPSWDGFNDKELLQLAQAQLNSKLARIDLREIPDSLSMKIDRAMKGLEENMVNDWQ